MKKKEEQTSVNETYRQMVNGTLAAMLAEKGRNKSWQDSEKEEPSQTLLYKRIEALLCFVLPLEIKKGRGPADVYEGRKWFFAEITDLLGIVKKDGFDPNPYTYIKEERFNFTDCASALLELLVLTKKHLSSSNDYLLSTNAIEETAKRAFDFLTSYANEEKAGRFSWAANDQLKFKGQSLANVYFTSYVVKSLSLLLIERPWAFVSENSARVLSLVQGGAVWLVDRFDGESGILYFDSQKTAASLLDFAFVSVALVHAYANLYDTLRLKADQVMQNFVQSLSREDITEPGYMYFLPPKARSPIYYDNRLSIAVVVSALCRIGGSSIIQSEMEEVLFSKLRILSADLIRTRDSRTNLWNEGNYLVTSTMWAVNALLDMEVYGRTAEYEISEAELYQLVKKALGDAKTVKAVTEVIQEELFRRKGSPTEGDTV